MSASPLQPDNNATAPGSLTRTEIWQQPELWPTTLAITGKDEFLTAGINRPVVFAGAGTSAHAAQSIVAAWPNARAIATTDLLVASGREIASELEGFLESGVLVSLGRSGDSPESLAVIQRLQYLAPQVKHVAITCNGDGALARAGDVHPIVLDPRTNDKSLVMTSSFTNLVLAGICPNYAALLGSSLTTICERVERQLPYLDALAEKLSEGPFERVAVLAGPPLRGLALECSLKILEMTAGQVATLPESFLGLRHGPMSFVTPHTLVICFLSSSPGRLRYEMDLIRELRQKKLGQVVVIGPEEPDLGLYDVRVAPNAFELPDCLRTPFEMPFAQLLAYHLSLKQGLNPDSPSPQATITRIVQPFNIYPPNAPLSFGGSDV